MKDKYSVRKPAHILGSPDMEVEDSGGYFPDEQSAGQYHNNKNEEYHKDRFRAMNLLRNELMTRFGAEKSLAVLDFGAGDGLELSNMMLPLASLHAIDTSDKILELASELFLDIPSTYLVGSTEQMKHVGSSTIDLVIAANVLGYLSDPEEAEFWAETKRVLKFGGFVITMTGNQLFDFFALNQGTAEFFESELNVSGAEVLLTQGSRPRFKSAKRHNPLKLEAQMEILGFKTLCRVWSQWHSTPPVIAEIEGDLTLREARKVVRDHSFNPNVMNPEDSWRALFQCSMFGNLFQLSGSGSNN
jgi:2-polyprenyl-3-methyl-5-hydroxy-6-metoxy-1,4-benzoquinol methylase